MTHINSLQINQFINQHLSFHLSGTELQVVQKILYCMPCQNKGHDLGSAYSMAMKHTARIIGRKIESVRQAIESLHARNIIQVDGRTWDQLCLSNGKRQKTGFTRSITFSKSFLKFLSSVFTEKKSEWVFVWCRKYEEKKARLRHKAKMAKDKLLSSIKNSRVPNNPPKNKKPLKSLLKPLLSPPPSPQKDLDEILENICNTLENTKNENEAMNTIHIFSQILVKYKMASNQQQAALLIVKSWKIFRSRKKE